MAMLRWIGEQFAVSFDHLPMLEHLVMKKASDAPLLQYKGIASLTDRWLHYQLIERQKIFVKKPQWIWLTRKALNAVDLDFPARAPSVARLDHIHAVNRVRLHFERKTVGQGIHWICEREANESRKKLNKKHQVDGEIKYPDGYTAAVEVELNQKRKPRLRSILRELQRDYDAVRYYVSDSSYTAVKNAIQEIPNYEETFILKKLSSLEESA